MNLFDINSKTFFEPATIDQINFNCDNIRFKLRKKMPVQVIADWQDPVKLFAPDDAEDNSQVLKDYVVLKKLTPYLKWLPNAFRLSKIKPTTLIAHIPYAFDTATRERLCKNAPILWVLYRFFAPANLVLEMFRSYCHVGIPRGFYSGYPRLDTFFKDFAQFQFKWKMARPNAKKIIWAPHWSINSGIRQATFQWNYQFMYEFAKSHLEISWIVKPHPSLFHSVIDSKIFPSHESFKEYMQAWNDLPNAQVVTGGYYQGLFATSDGMIHDCGSFTAEYQYVDKPMIFLKRKLGGFNDLGNEIMKVSYCVDGKDHDAIAAMMQRVFIEGDDYKAAERRELFDKYLNYPKANGMLASELIYHSIADELKKVSE